MRGYLMSKRGGPGRGQGRKPIAAGQLVRRAMVTLPVAELEYIMAQDPEARAGQKPSVSRGIREILRRLARYEGRA
jgi:hypothetical protein